MLKAGKPASLKDNFITILFSIAAMLGSVVFLLLGSLGLIYVMTYEPPRPVTIEAKVISKTLSGHHETVSPKTIQIMIIYISATQKEKIVTTNEETYLSCNINETYCFDYFKKQNSISRIKAEKEK